MLKRSGTLQMVFYLRYLKLDPVVSEYTSYLIGIEKISSSLERENDAQNPLALPDVLLKMAVALTLTSLHCQITSSAIIIVIIIFIYLFIYLFI